MTESNELCRVIPVGDRRYTYGNYECLKPAKGTLKDGTPACGVHLAAEKRRETNESDRKIQAQIKRQQFSAMEELCNRLGVGFVSESFGAYSIRLSSMDVKKLLAELNR